MKEVYMDYAASAPVWPSVVEAMSSVSDGNPSSPHSVGEKARKELDAARKELAAEICAKAGEVIFTSGATESNNLALRGVFREEVGNGKNDQVEGIGFGGRGKVIVSAVEHASVWEVAQDLGVEVVVVGVDSEGKVKMGELRKLVDNETLLVSVQHANNEFGTVQPIEEIGALCKEKGVLFHVDAAQTFGKLEIDVGRMGIDLLSASAHKIGGPKGVGFLFVRDGLELAPVLVGGGQEKGLRSGTENVAGAVGFAKALEEQLKLDMDFVRGLRDRLLEGLEKLGGKLVGSRECCSEGQPAAAEIRRKNDQVVDCDRKCGIGGERLWNNVMVGFAGVDGEDLVMRLSEKGVMCGTGSACSSRKGDGRVLGALGLSEKEAGEVVRFSLGAEHTEGDVQFVLEKVGEIVKLQGLNHSS
jgi:cysteine desulfurase